MIRYFCDSCGKELEHGEHGRIKRQYRRIRVEVITAVDGTWNAGNLCHGCIVHAVANGVPEEQWHLYDENMTYLG